MATEMELITVIVQRRDERKILDALQAAGAPGMTYYYGRGTGVRQKLGLFGALIEEEKLVVLSVVPVGQAEGILARLSQTFDLTQPGRGFAFVQRVGHVYGYYADGGAAAAPP